MGSAIKGSGEWELEGNENGRKRRSIWKYGIGMALEGWIYLEEGRGWGKELSRMTENKRGMRVRKGGG